MKILQSLRLRIFAACFISAVIACIASGIVLQITVRINDDELFNWHIAEVAGNIVKSYENNETVDVFGDEIFVGSDKEVLNKISSQFEGESKTKIEKALNLGELCLHGPHEITKQGFEIFELNSETRNLHILKANLKTTDKSLYYIIDVTDFDVTETDSAQLIEDIFIASLIGTLILSLIIGAVLARKVIYPLTRLSQEIEQTSVEEYKETACSYYNDEVGFLAKKLNSFIRRTKKFVDREKAFTRDASHELRTPVANSMAAVELLETHPELQSSKIQKVLQRITRSNLYMSHLIETFLFMGKEENETEEVKEFNLAPVVNISFCKNSSFCASEVRCVNSVADDFVLKVPEHLLSIALDNLIRNALQHTNSGSVEVFADDACIKVIDTGVGLPKDSEEYEGIGLNIVKRICKILKWEVELENSETGVIAKLNYKS